MKPAIIRNERKAMALVIVLGALVLITLLCVAFFASTSRELTASKSYASGVSARFYADAAVNVVLGQLGAATTQDDATKVWTSQPGLLRQFDNQGNQTQVFKLYSSDKMISTGTFTLFSGSLPADVPSWSSATPTESLPWNSDPGVYTDLNAPVTVGKKPNYPILNPGGLQTATRIQGFDVLANYGLPDTKDLDKDGDTGEIGQIPMPVRWLYVLKDGSLATATRTADKQVALSLAGGGPVPDSNPPVARIAFWTDDDTCRLNVNTASDGEYWTLPVAVAADDSLAAGQVTAREYQRYPGHPAATSLSPALDFLTSNTTDLRNFIFALSPRISGRGSQFGSRLIGYGYPVQPDDDRLYASVDDLLFLPNFNAGTGERYRMNTDNIKALKVNELDYVFSSHVQTSMAGSNYSFSTPFSLDAPRLELLRFFLTVDSNAPEVNLFGKPRISLWPVDTRAAYQSIYDKLLAFSASVNGSKYFFQRQNPDSQTDDIVSISRNEQLLDYLDRLTSMGIPGVGGNFSGKYSPSDRAQILTSIFDWVRTVNLAYRDPAGVVLPYAWQVNPATSGTTTGQPPGLPGSGQVLPIKFGTSTGFGRFPTLSKGALAIVREAEEEEKDSGGVNTGKLIVRYRVIFLMETYVPMMGYAGYIPNYQINVSNLNAGFEAVTSLDSVTQTFPLTFQNGAIQVNVPANVEPYYGRAWGGTQGYQNLLLYSDSATGYSLKPRVLGLANPQNGYPFVSTQFSLVVDPAKKNLIKVGLRPVGGAAQQTVNVELKNAQGTETMGSYSLPFPGFSPVAGAFYGDVTASASPGNGKLHPNLQERVNQMAEAWKVYEGGQNVSWIAEKAIFGSVDIVRGLELGHGDLRMLALHGSNANNTFVPHFDYTSTRPQAHSLESSGGSVWSYNNEGVREIPADPTQSPKMTAIRRGVLVPNSQAGFSSGTPLNHLPQAPSSWDSNARIPALHDFTTGIGSEGDGPHIMKADEGNTSNIGHGWGMSQDVPYQNQIFPWNAKLSDSFSPNRQVTSAVQLGTLPSRAASNETWQTLLFRPNFTSLAHPGAAPPADSALLDLFWMPVVDPYPISQPLSTAGKVNMNSQIAPFTYIERSTALLGALKSTRVMAIPPQHSEYYKWSGYTVDASKGRYAISYLYDVDAKKTLYFFNERFNSSNASDNAFKSPSEICAIPLVPKQRATSVVSTGHSENTPPNAIASTNIGGAGDVGSLRAALADFWSKNTLSGDNVLEAPYNHLYPRLTTQSNTYTVYVRAQSLQIPPNTALSNLPESRIKVSGEYRGSFGIDRYIDPNDAAIPDFAATSNASKTLYPYYKFRVKGSRQFLPQ